MRKPSQNTKPEEAKVPTAVAVKPTTAAKNLMARRDRARAILDRLDDKTCAELGRRARGAVRDGFPSSSGGGGVSTSDVSRPTEASALVGLPDVEDQADDWVRHESPADPVGDAIAEVFATMGEAVGLLLVIDGQRGYVLATGDDKRGRVSSLGSCSCCCRDVACTPEDRLRAGFCGACYQAWVRGGRPERVGFIRDRRAAAEDVA